MALGRRRTCALWRRAPARNLRQPLHRRQQSHRRSIRLPLSRLDLPLAPGPVDHPGDRRTETGPYPQLHPDRPRPRAQLRAPLSHDLDAREGLHRDGKHLRRGLPAARRHGIAARLYMGHRRRAPGRPLDGRRALDLPSRRTRHGLRHRSLESPRRNPARPALERPLLPRWMAGAPPTPRSPGAQTYIQPAQAPRRSPMPHADHRRDLRAGRRHRSPAPGARPGLHSAALGHPGLSIGAGADELPGRPQSPHRA